MLQVDGYKIIIQTFKSRSLICIKCNLHSRKKVMLSGSNLPQSHIQRDGPEQLAIGLPYSHR